MTISGIPTMRDQHLAQFRDVKISRNLEVTGDFSVAGSFMFGDASYDNLIIKGRLTSTDATGSDIDLTSAFTYGNSIRLRYSVSSWTGIGTDYSAMYLRVQNAVSGTGKNLTCAQMIAVANATFSLGELHGLYVECGMKASGTQTIGTSVAVEGSLAPYTGTGAITITNYWASFLATPSGVNSRIDATNAAKIHGFYLLARDGDGSNTKLGSGIEFVSDTAQSGTRTLTDGVKVNIGCTTGLNVAGNTTTGLLLAGTATDGVSITGVCTDAIHISGTNTATGLHISGDQVDFALFDVDAAADNGLKILVDDGITLGVGINLDRSGTTGVCTTGISIDTDGTTGIDIAAGFTGVTGIQVAGTASGDGILVSGACADGIHISGTNSASGLHISGDQADSILLDIDAATANGIHFMVDDGITLGTGINIAKTGTTGITTTGIAVSTNCTTGLSLSGTNTTGIDITGTMTRGIRLGTHDWGVGLTGIVLSTTDPLFQVAGRIAASNSTAGVYACAYKQLALTSATQNTDTSWFADWNELYITPTTGTSVLTGSSHYAAVKGHVEISGTVTSSTGVTASIWGSNIIPTGYVNNGTIAGVYVDGIISTGITNNGDTMAFGIGGHSDSGQGHWEYGLYMAEHSADTGIKIEPLNMTRGFLIGKPYAGSGTTSTGLKILTNDTTWNAGATCGIYFDDGGSALTAWGEGFTVGTTILTNSTGGTHSGWPYTGFFYTDVEANVTDNGSNHWPTLMTSFIVGSSKTLSGFTVGASSHHASVDVNGTLDSGSKLSCISFGGNWPGTISGAFVVPLHVRPTNQNWTSFVKFESATNGCFQTAGSSTGTLSNCPHSGNPTYWLKIDIAGTNYCIPVFAVT